MLRTMLLAVAGLLVGAGSLPADEVKGKIKKVDAEKSTILVTVADKDQEFKITGATKLLGPSGKDLPGGLTSQRLAEGAEVMVTCENKDGKDVCTKVQLKGQKTAAAANEVKGKIKKIDADKNTITVTIGDKDQELKITGETKVLGPSGKDLKGGLTSSRLAEGAEVAVICEKKDGSDVCTKVQLKGQKKDK